MTLRWPCLSYTTILVLLLCSIAPWRLELFFKSTAELKSKVLPFIKEHGITRINITNKVLPSLDD